ncbi:hypothetical protein [Aestuariivirga sp.]|uniref:hypothetical protein n=1 Tax=Aestuariivirga sp. TaxID=2650926 RepID=UPI0039E5A13F
MMKVLALAAAFLLAPGIVHAQDKCPFGYAMFHDTAAKSAAKLPNGQFTLYEGEDFELFLKLAKEATPDNWPDDFEDITSAVAMTSSVATTGKIVWIDKGQCVRFTSVMSVDFLLGARHIIIGEDT